MKTDAYTKIVLTIIAVCLTINVLKELEIVQSVHAKTNEGNLLAPQSSTMDVRIVDWKRTLIFDPLPVKISD